MIRPRFRPPACLAIVMVGLLLSAELRAQEEDAEVSRLVAKLGSPRIETRMEACRRLAQMPFGGYERLKAARLSRDAEVRWRAREILRSVHAHVLAVLEAKAAEGGQPSEETRQGWRWLVSLGEAGVEPLLDVCALRLRDDVDPENDPLAGLAMSALSEMLGSQAETAMLALLDRPLHPLAACVIQRVGVLRLRSAIPSLLDSLERGNSVVRARAAWALAWIGEDERIVPALLETMEGETVPETRHDLAFALAKLGDDRHLDAALVYSREKTEATPPNLETLNRLGNACLLAGRLDEAARAFERILAFNPSNLEAAYNLACVKSLGKEADEGLRYLRMAVDNGLSDASWLENDGDLDNLRPLAEFQLLLESLRGTKSPPE